MPTYAFRCSDCGRQFEEFMHTFGATAPCPACGSKNVERQVSAPATHTGDSLSTKLSKNQPNCGNSGGSRFG